MESAEYYGWEETCQDTYHEREAEEKKRYEVVDLEVPSQQSLVDGLEGNGWIGDAIAAYAEGAKLHTEDLRELLVFYLHASNKGLNLASSGGLAVFRGRQRLLESLER